MPKHEPILFNTKTLIVFSCLALGALFYVFPGTNILKSINTKPTDIATLAYFRAAYLQNPNDPSLRLNLVKKLFEINQIDEAISLLEPLNHQAERNLEVASLNLQLKFRQYFDTKSTSEKARLKIEILHELNWVYPQLANKEDLEELAEVSMQLGEPATAAMIYRKLVEISAHQAPASLNLWQWFGINNALAAHEDKSTEYYIQQQLNALLAAKKGAEALAWVSRYAQEYPENDTILQAAIDIALGENDTVRARDFGRQLFSLSSKNSRAVAVPSCQNKPQSDQRDWTCDLESTAKQDHLKLPAAAYINLIKNIHHEKALEQQIKRELAANQLDNSIHWIQQQLLAKPDSEALLRAGIKIAGSQGNKVLGNQWGERLLSLKPNDSQLLEQQIRLAMSVPDLPKALSYAKRWVALEPKSQAAHNTAADVALWAGDSHTALDQLFWLYQNSQSNEYLDKITPLASALFKYNLLADLYARIGNTRQLTEGEMSTWFTAQQNSSLEDAGISLLQNYLARWPADKSAWALLAKNYELHGNLAAKNATLQHFSQHFGSDLDLKLSQAELLIKLGKMSDAWQIILAASPNVPATNQVFWDKFAELAFTVGAESELLQAYQRNPDIGHNNSALNFYFLKMLRQGDKPELYREFALKQFYKSQNPETLLDLVAFNITNQHWLEAQKLLNLLDEKNLKLQKSIQYWLAKAEVSGHFGDKATAQQAIQTALQLKPESASTRSLLIWHLLAEQNIPALSQLLADSSTQANDKPELWEAMAAGYRTIKQPKAAMHWYAKAVKQWPSKQSLVMGYADVLQEANEVNKAKQLWRYILVHFMPSLALKNQNSNTENADFERRYAEIVRLYLGPIIGEQWLKHLTEHQQQDSKFSEFRINWFLAQQRQAQVSAEIAQADAQGQTIPPWQRLALALKSKDVPTATKILATDAKKLSAIDQISALRLIGKDKAALDKTNQILNAPNTKSEQDWLNQQALDLNRQIKNGWALSGKMFNVSELDILSDRGDLAFSLGKHHFYSFYQDYYYSFSNSKFHLNDDLRHEQQVEVAWEYLGECFQSLWKMGGAFRGDSDYFSSEAQLHYQLPWHMTAHLNAAYNQISTEGALYRLMGLSDKADLRLSGELSKRIFYGVNFSGQDYKTRSGESIGTGYASGFEAGYRVFFEHPETTILLHGLWKEADLQTGIPLEWHGLVAPNTRMSEILNNSYQEIGLEVMLKEGEFNAFGFTNRNFRYYLNAGGFYTEPLGSIGGKVEVGLGIRLFDHDEISLLGYYATVQSAVQSIPSSAIELRYSRRFD